MATNPDPARITDALWYLWERLHELEPSSKLGGIYAFKSGYHSTRKDNQNNWPGDYSIVDGEDKGGPSDKAAAIDWTFPDAQAADYDTIARYSDRLIASGEDADDDRLNGWREFYGQCDTDTHVEGYDFRYGEAATSDPSHLWHIHLSCDRDKVTSIENMDKLLSVLRGEDVSLSPEDIDKVADETVEKLLKKNLTIPEDWKTQFPDDPTIQDGEIGYDTCVRSGYFHGRQGNEQLDALEAKVDQILAALAGGTLPPPGPTTSTTGKGTFTFELDPTPAP